jgi:hypothetical protein
MNSLPSFKPRQYDIVLQYITNVLINKQPDTDSAARDLIAYDDGHYRVLFRPSYFVLSAGQDQPSKSQWNSLKKKMKRYDRKTFVFKEHGEIEHEDGETYCYIDVGFFER